MAKSRNFLLEKLDGDRVYMPPPNMMLVECEGLMETKGGVLLPENVEGEKNAPLGKVLAVGSGRDTWKGEEPPAQKDDYVVFAPGLYPPVPVHDDVLSIHFDTVMLRIVMGDSAKDEGVFYQPESALVTE